MCIFNMMFRNLKKTVWKARGVLSKKPWVAQCGLEKHVLYGKFVTLSCDFIQREKHLKLILNIENTVDAV
jgi:hypothetical protein